MKKINLYIDNITTMSLQDYLGNYSRDIAARQQHQNDTDNAVSERKATTLEEHFQNAKDAIEAGGAELGGAGAAFHLGRKIYRQTLDRRAKRTADAAGRNNANAQQDGNTNPAANDSRVNEESGGRSTAGGEGEGEGSIESNFQALRQRVGAASAEEAKDPTSAIDPESAAHGGEEAPVTETSNPASAEGVNDRAAATQERVGGDFDYGESRPFPEAPTTSVANPTGEPVTQAKPIESSPEFLQNQTHTPLQSTPDHAGSTANDAPSARAAGVTEPAPPAAEAPEGDVEQGARAFQTRANQQIASNTRNRIAADGKAAMDTDGAASKISSKVGGGLDDALSGVSDALDFLGPVGEIAGVITGLVGLFEGIGHKTAPPTLGKAGEFAQQSAGGGMDVKALTAQPTGAATTAY